MKKKLLFAFSLFFTFIFVVNANEIGVGEQYIIERLANTNATKINSVSVSGDIATIYSTGAINAIAYGTSSQQSSSATTKIYTTSNSYSVGVKNGTYYFWVYDSGQISGSVAAIRYAAAVPVTTSCSNQVITNGTGTGTVERCYVYDGNYTVPDVKENFITCAPGYSIREENVSINYNGCAPGTLNINYNGQTVNKRYCKVVFNYTCTKNDSGSSSGGGTGGGGSSGGGSVVAPAASLSDLFVSVGSLNPSFSSLVKTYNVTVPSNTESIIISATAAGGSSFVSGAGPRTVELNYGMNSIPVSVKNSAGAVVTYTVNVNRVDDRLNVNTLASLQVSEGTLEPAFDPTVTTYKIYIPDSVTSLRVDATVSDPSSRLEEGYGSRDVQLYAGFNPVEVRVRSENESLRTYTIFVIRDNGSSACLAETDDLALLKELNITTDLPDVELDDIEFDPQTFTYNLKVPYEVGNILVEAFVKNEGDKVEIDGGSNLEVNVEQIVTVTVSSLSCSEVSKSYTIAITRLSENVKSSVADVLDIKIDGHDEFVFNPNDVSEIILNKKEKQLGINLELADENTTCNIEGNEKLSVGDEITIKCTSEDESTTIDYVIKVTGAKKGTNGFLVFLVVILLIGVAVYLVLRLLGYKIYFNFAMIGAFFRSLGDKFKKD